MGPVAVVRKPNIATCGAKLSVWNADLLHFTKLSHVVRTKR